MSSAPVPWFHIIAAGGGRGPSKKSFFSKPTTQVPLVFNVCENGRQDAIISASPLARFSSVHLSIDLKTRLLQSSGCCFPQEAAIGKTNMRRRARTTHCRV